MIPSTSFLDQSENQRRQFIDAETAFLAAAKAKRAAEVRGSMLWRELRGKSTLIRTSANSAQKSLGPRSTETEAICNSFMARKQLAEERLNRTLRVGRVPNVAVDIIRHATNEADPHSLRTSDDEDDFWAIHVSMGEKLQCARWTLHASNRPCPNQLDEHAWAYFLAGGTSVQLPFATSGSV